MNKTIGITGLIISIVAQSFSADDSLSHKIATGLLFLSIAIYNFDHAKDYSKASLVVICLSFFILALGIHKLLSFSSDLFDNVNINFGAIFILQITIIIGSVAIAISIMKFICDRLKKKPNGKEC
ncbi:YoqO family protein [Bacillus sp. FSL R5-0447]|uniref:YoqO family protein n=1 Tax=Bacillus sp. FSL R5-0447 TaxID=2975303 RepID=UPI00315A8780